MDTTQNTNQWRLALLIALFSAIAPPVLQSQVHGEEINVRVENTLKGHEGRVDSVVFLPDGETIVTASWGDEMIRLRDVETKTQTLFLEELDEELNGYISLSPDGRTLASTSLSLLYTVADPSSPLGYSIGPITAHVTLRDLKAGPSRTLTNDDYKIDMTPGGASPNIRVLHVAFSPDGEVLASANFRGTVTLWDIKTGKVLRTLETLADSSGDSGFMAFSPNGKVLAWAGGYRVGNQEDGFKVIGEVLLLDVETGKQTKRLGNQDRYVTSIAFTPDGKTLASLTYNEINLWDTETGELKHKIDDFANQRLAISPDGKTFASVGYDITLWEMATAKMIVKIKDGSRASHSVAFSPDGKILAVGGGGVRLWNVKGNRLEPIPPAADGTGEP